MRNLISSACILFAACSGFYFGYQYPRDVEIESTKPVVFQFEITSEAARILALKATEGVQP